MPRRRRDQPLTMCRDWNKRYPIGTLVRYHPVIGEPGHRVRKTRSEAYVLSGHTAVVFLEDESGCVAIEACEPTAPTGDAA